jgi:hypothetical protein
LIACDEKGVTFKWKDYRIEGPERYKVMTLPTHEFIRRFQKWGILVLMWWTAPAPGDESP